MAVDASLLHAVVRDTVGLVVRAAVPPTDATADTTTPTASAAPTPSPTDPPSKGGNTQSPLLFFVALGFGVVFTNLWYALCLYTHISRLTA